MLLLARALVLSEAFFLALLAMDVPLGFAWLLHLAPAIVLVLSVAITWRRPMAAGLVVLSLGLLATLVFHTFRSIPAFLAVSGPLIVAGVLFLFAAAPRDKKPGT